MSALNHRESARTYALRREPGLELSLAHYDPGASQDRHAHDHLQLSFLIAGELCESVGSASEELMVPAASIMPIGTEHAELTGGHGATLLTLGIELPDEDAFGFDTQTAWRRISLAPVINILRVAFANDHQVGLDTIGDDLITLYNGAEGRVSETAPIWLQRVRDAIADGETLTAAEAADLAGVHRVHLSRSFVRYFGLSISAYRQRVMVARAVDAMLRSEGKLADVAQHAGFTDQSHMHRIIGRQFGTTPGVLRRAFAN